jgi:hypothetical protein
MTSLLRNSKKLFLFVAFLLPLFAFSQYRKMGGVNFDISNYFPQKESGIPALQRISANYICLTPYAVLSSNSNPEIHYGDSIEWWGAAPANMDIITADARKYGMKVMLKPHFWVIGKGWAGQLNFSEENWQKWEVNYTQFILMMARIAEKNKMESFCFGCELKSAVRNRPQFFIDLIPKIRKVYHGKLLYAANWDSYTKIPFWHLLDYIGIDAYFPIADGTTPSQEEIASMWMDLKLQLKDFSMQFGKQIVFTEYGYRSIDRALSKQWVIEGIPQNQQMNMETQKRGYQGFFDALWNEPWVAGAFLWKWYPDDTMGGLDDSDYTPQHKPVEELIQTWYEKVFHYSPKIKK